MTNSLRSRSVPALAARTALAAVLFASWPGVTPLLAAETTASKRTLTLEGARQIADAAAAEAKRDNAGGAIAIVDDGGNLLLLERLDNTFPAGAYVAIDKARTAAQFRRPTSVFEDAIKGGRVSLVAVTQMTPLQGGVPILVDGQVVGAIGVSGAMSAAQDEEIAKAAAASFMGGGMADGRMPASGVVSFFPASDVSAAFAKGRPLFETAGYKVHASRREAAGQAEVHEEDTDILYVLDGQATIVTGGSMQDGKQIAPGELRGSGITGGGSRRLVKGDVMVIPNGVPHWFESIKGPFLYFVVKSTGGGGVR